MEVMSFATNSPGPYYLLEAERYLPCPSPPVSLRIPLDARRPLVRKRTIQNDLVLLYSPTLTPSPILNRLGTPPRRDPTLQSPRSLP